MGIKGVIELSQSFENKKRLSRYLTGLLAKGWLELVRRARGRWGNLPRGTSANFSKVIELYRRGNKAVQARASSSELDHLLHVHGSRL